MAERLSEMELYDLAEEVGLALAAAGVMAVAAESCTGGLVGHLLTEIPGSSAWFAGSAVTYSYQAKERLLQVDHETLERLGAVSPEVAAQMAQGACQLFAADVAVAVTGIAGPGGGTPDKPVGLVYFHLHAPARPGFPAVNRAERRVWPGDRRGNKLLSAQLALHMLGDFAQQVKSA
jgi:PncC family amidohydrolase